jgi:hypothetical protein
MEKLGQFIELILTKLLSKTMFGLTYQHFKKKQKNIQEHCINMEVSHEHSSGVCVIVTANKSKIYTLMLKNIP